MKKPKLNSVFTYLITQIRTRGVIFDIQWYEASIKLDKLGMDLDTDSRNKISMFFHFYILLTLYTSVCLFNSFQ